MPPSVNLTLVTSALSPKNHIRWLHLPRLTQGVQGPGRKARPRPGQTNKAQISPLPESHGLHGLGRALSQVARSMCNLPIRPHALSTPCRMGRVIRGRRGDSLEASVASPGKRPGHSTAVVRTALSCFRADKSGVPPGTRAILAFCQRRVAVQNREGACSMHSSGPNYRTAAAVGDEGPQPRLCLTRM